ncbi:MAG: dTDP-4-dehydrorhamnose reductase [Candidatus Woykebacteria bacterium GWB1_45_5]|uniref:dTDP-4-dehydrorhamnose reductase n=2 Tax=Candidatus Woykeibacteriota TaxID=1817899 RepID=A0A1G1W1X5_9BACT|nr:MAG: dTDP-4-dehydrorhamnose reductase [Candidatus Woykebacteria bacterium GWA1_44_8]OGY23035.1 MAG: dTDP-4-dehydrorhamnose reductase [Candidatus Woykebacteria bacterium GWB1_45_5]
MSSGKKKILVTGANGQLGQEIVRVFEKDWAVIASDTNNLDITNKSQVKQVINKEKPVLVIHCAAWTNVDAAVENPEGAMRVNGDGTRNICEAFRKVQGRQTTDHGGQLTVDYRPIFVYISTNEVFDGEKKTPYREEDKPNPINSYGKSKLAGEKYCQAILGKNCLIARSSWLYGPASENNFPNKILRKAKEQGFLKVTSDEVATPTYAPDLAKGVRELVKKNALGIFHLVNEGQTSRYDWAKQIVKEKKLNVSVEPIKLGSFSRPSKPPKYSVLANTRAKKVGVVLRDWQQASREYLSKLT